MAAAKAQLLQMVQAGHSVKAAMVGMTQEGKYSSKELTEALRQTKTGMKDVGTQTTKTSRILERIFAAAIIGFVLGAVRNLINVMKEAVEAGAELSRSMLDIQVSARALQRTGMETTIREWVCLLYTSPSPRDRQRSRMPSSA